MAFCSQCGKRVEDHARFCIACGAKIDTDAARTASGASGNAQNQAPHAKRTGSYEKFIAYDDTSASYTENDRQENRLVSVLAYLHILVLVPWIGMKESPFAQYHAKVGANLLVWHILAEFLGHILIISLSWIAVLGQIVTAFVVLFNLLLWAINIFGIVSVARGRARQLQILSPFKLIK